MAHDLRAYADWCIAHYEDVPPTIVNDLNAAATLIEQQEAKIEALEKGKIIKWISVRDQLLPGDASKRVLVKLISCADTAGYPSIDTDRYVGGGWVR